MAGISTYLANKLLDGVLGGTNYTQPATVYVALYTSSPGAGGSANTNEATGTGYARVAVTNNNTNFPAASAGSKSNGVVITFPTPGAGGWGTVTHFAIVDSASGAGNILFFTALDVAKTINQNDIIQFDASSNKITVTLS